MGFQAEGGFVITTTHDNYVGKRVDEQTLKKIIELLKIPKSDYEALTADKIRSILVYGPK
jgi:hypothetical protein